MYGWTDRGSNPGLKTASLEVCRYGGGCMLIGLNIWTRRDLNPQSPPCRGDILPDYTTRPSVEHEEKKNIKVLLFNPDTEILEFAFSFEQLVEGFF